MLLPYYNLHMTGASVLGRPLFAFGCFYQPLLRRHIALLIIDNPAPALATGGLNLFDTYVATLPAAYQSAGLVERAHGAAALTSKQH